MKAKKKAAALAAMKKELEARKRWEEWRMTATPEEVRLLGKACELAELFEDMRFETGTCSGELLPGRMEMPPGLSDDPVSLIRYRVFSDDGETGGFYDDKRHELAIRADLLESDETILHELLHLYEGMYTGDFGYTPSYFRDLLFWALFRQVRERIPRLEEIVTAFARMDVQGSIDDKGGPHDLLFLLKSLELDTRKGYPLGTVFGYGWADELKGYEVRRDKGD